MSASQTKATNTKGSNKESKNISHQVKKIGSEDNFKEYAITAISFVKTVITGVTTRAIPFLNNAYQKYGKDLIANYPQALTIASYLPLIMETYCVLFHIMMVRLWIMFNFICTALWMYDSVSENNDSNTKTKRFIPVTMIEIKKISSVCIGLGVVLILFFTRTVGFFTLPLIVYLINRTAKNVFNRGF